MEFSLILQGLIGLGGLIFYSIKAFKLNQSKKKKTLKISQTSSVNNNDCSVKKQSIDTMCSEEHNATHQNSSIANSNGEEDENPLFKFFSHPLHIIFIIIFSVIFLNALFTFFKMEGWVVASVLNYNETFNMVMTAASLMSTFIIAVLQYKIQKTEDRKNKIEQKEAEKRLQTFQCQLQEEQRDYETVRREQSEMQNQAFQRHLTDEIKLRESMRNRQNKYSLISDNMKKYVAFTNEAEIEFNQKGFLRLYLFYKDGCSPIHFKYKLLENTSVNMSISGNDNNIETTINSIKNTYNAFVVEINFSSENKKAISDLVYNFFMPLNYNCLEDDVVTISFSCNITDESLFNALYSSEDSKLGEYISWDASFYVTLTPTQKVSESGNLKFKSICESGVLYGNINKGN